MFSAQHPDVGFCAPITMPFGSPWYRRKAGIRCVELVLTSLLVAHAFSGCWVDALIPTTWNHLRHDKFSRMGPPPSFILNTRSRTHGDIEPLTRRNVTTQVGQTVYLHCIVDTVENPTVSWIRLRDFHLLTVKTLTYTSDDRFLPVHLEHSKDWALQIKYPQRKDEGHYECQINTNPVSTHHVFLRVLEPKAKILGGSDIFVQAGSAINLTCIIDYSPEPPVFVFWYHGDRMINYDPAKGEINVRKTGGDSAVSWLYIQNGQVEDSGNYTCCPSNAAATSIQVHVLKGEKQAAVQNDARPLTNGVLTSPPQSTCLLYLAFIVILVHR